MAQMHTDDKDIRTLSGDRLIHRELTQKIIGAAMQVHDTLGSGFLEKVYENALAIELRNNSTVVEQQKPITVRYSGQVVGEYLADLLVDHVVIVEPKTAERLSEGHKAQTLNYLRATGLKVGLVINFGSPRLEWQRVVA